MISIFLSILITSNPSIISSLLVNMKRNTTDLFLNFHCKESDNFQKEESKRVFAMFPGSWPSFLDLQGDVFAASVGRIICFHIDWQKGIIIHELDNSWEFMCHHDTVHIGSLNYTEKLKVRINWDAQRILRTTKGFFEYIQIRKKKDRK